MALQALKKLFLFTTLNILDIQPAFPSSAAPSSVTPGTQPTVVPTLHPHQICQDQAGTECSKLPAVCLQCSFNESCLYGKQTTANCTVNSLVKCVAPRNFSKMLTCQYCYQTSRENHTCSGKRTCQMLWAIDEHPHIMWGTVSCSTLHILQSVASNPLERVIVNCTVNENTLCLGRRTFLKSLPCNWTSGYRWSTAMILSVTLGGFGVDRFYLGHWKEGLGKLFSFGGLAVWTLVDIVLIGVGYVRPADGSLYIF